jgi:hypothetical protein
LLPQSRRAVALVAVLATALAPACSGKHEKAAPAPVTSSASSPTPSATPAPPPKPKPVHPFTGGKNVRKPVVVVKIDNTNNAMPQSGLAQADIIYQELVESGLTRLAAVYSSRTPTYVGPVRSGRETDIELLAQYSRVTLAYSGAQHGVLRKIRAANLVNGRYDDALSAYTLAPTRHRPYSTYVSIPRLIGIKPGAKARNIGFRFGKLAAGARKAASLRLRWSQYVTNTIRYDAKSRRWQVSVNGRRQVSMDNVIVQYVSVHRSRYHDVNGANSPLSRTVGRGKGLLFRDGRVIAIRWSRKAKRRATTWTDAKGNPMTLRTGTTYVMLVPKGRKVTFK